MKQLVDVVRIWLIIKKPFERCQLRLFTWCRRLSFYIFQHCRCCSPDVRWQTSDQSVLLHKLDELPLVLREKERTKELRYAQLLYDLEQVNFIVQVALGLHEDLLLLGPATYFTAAAAVETAAKAVNLRPEPVASSL